MSFDSSGVHTDYTQRMPALLLPYCMAGPSVLVPPVHILRVLFFHHRSVFFLITYLFCSAIWFLVYCLDNE